MELFKKNLLKKKNKFPNLKYKCDLCENCFRDTDDLHDHILQHISGNTVFSCQFCKQTFQTKVQHQKHERLHVRKTSFHCLQCFSSFSLPKYLVDHCRKHREKSNCKSNYGRDVNGKTKQKGNSTYSDHVTYNKKQAKQSKLTKSKQVELEWISESGDKPPEKEKATTKIISKTCEICGKVFARASNVLQHMRLHRGERPFPCSICEKTFHRSDHLKIHERIHSKERQFQCEHCLETFKRRDHLKYHQINFHGGKIHLNELRKYSRHAFGQPQKKTILCDVCGTSFGNERNLKNHLRIHSNQGKYSCQFCSRSFNQSSNLNIHLRRHTGQTPYKCLHCDKSFTTSTKLKTHAREHTGELPFTCNICGRLFGQEHLLKMHMRIHNDQKQFKCSHCDQMFMHSSTLRAHVRTHTKEKPYRCDECGDSFAQISSLTYHRRTHSGEKPYSCDICGKSYTRRATLNVHLTRHTGQKRISCPRCDFKCDALKNLRKHIDKVHSELKDSADLLLKQTRGRVLGALYSDSVIDSNIVGHQSLASAEVVNVKPIDGSKRLTAQPQEIISRDFSPTGKLDPETSSKLTDDRRQESQTLISVPHSKSEVSDFVSHCNSANEGQAQLPQSKSTSAEMPTSVGHCNSANIGQAQFYSCYVNYPVLSPIQFGLNQMQPATLGTFFPVQIPDPTLLPDGTVIYIRPNSLQDDQIHFSVYPSLMTDNTSVPAQISFNDSQVSSPGHVNASMPAPVATSFYHQSCHNEVSHGDLATLTQAQYDVASDSLLTQGYSNALGPTGSAFLDCYESISQDKIHNTGDDAHIHNTGNDAHIHNTGNDGQIHNTGNDDQIHNTGDDAHMHNTGNDAHIHNTGNYRQIHNTGNNGQIHNTGNDGQIQNTGNDAHIQNTGNNGQIHNTGNDAQIHNTGDDTQIDNTGNDAYIHNTGNDGQIHHTGNDGQIQNTGNDGQIHNTGNNAHIHNTGYDTQIHNVRDDGQKHTKTEEIKAHYTGDNSQMQNTSDDCQTHYTGNNGQIHNTGDETQIDNISDDSQTSNTDDDSQTRNTDDGSQTRNTSHDNEVKDESKARQENLSCKKLKTVGKDIKQLQPGIGDQDFCLKFESKVKVKESTDLNLKLSPFKKFKLPASIEGCVSPGSEKSVTRQCYKGKKLITNKYSLKNLNDNKVSKKEKDDRLSKELAECKICGQKFSRVGNLTTHMRLHSGERPHACRVCNKTFSRSDHLKTHKLLHGADKALLCNHCGETFAGTDQLRGHIRGKHENMNPFACNMCTFSCIHLGELKDHIKSHEGKISFACEICCLTFAKAKDLKQHMASHSGQSPFACHICHKTFKESSCLKLHIRTKHTGEKHFKCGVCGDTFFTAAKLQRHIRNHSGARPFTCEFCGKMFLDSCLLKMHVRIHTKEKPFKCKQCEQCFTHPSTLRAHVRIHTGNKPYSCSLCDASFSQVSSLSYHQRKHDGLKPYTCHICGNSYTRSTTLNIHLTRHTGLKRVSCPHCTFKCDTPKHLRKHVAKLHSGNGPAKNLTPESKNEVFLKETQSRCNFRAAEVPFKNTQVVHHQTSGEPLTKVDQVVLNQVPPALAVPELIPPIPAKQYENRDRIVEGYGLSKPTVDGHQQVFRSLISSQANDFVARNVVLTSSTLDQF